MFKLSIVDVSGYIESQVHDAEPTVGQVVKIYTAISKKIERIDVLPLSEGRKETVYECFVR